MEPSSMTNIVKHRLYSSFIVILCLSSCASIPLESVNNRINAWKSSPIEDLIKYWGVPSKSKLVNGINYSEWVNEENESGNTSLSIGSGTSSRHSALGIGVTLFNLGGEENSCSRLVSYQENGKIIEITWKGTQDFCFKLTPDREEILARRKVDTE